MGRTKRKSAASAFAVLLVLLLCTGFLFTGNKSLIARAENATGVTDFWVETSYENVFRDAEKQPDAREQLNLLAVKNEYESEQIVLKHSADFTVTGVTFTDLTYLDNTIAKENLTYNFVGYVKMNNSSGQSESTVVRWTGSTSTSATSGTMDFFPDRLYNRRSISVKANEAQPVYITLYVPKTAVAGSYSGSVTVSTSLGDLTVPLSAEIANVTLADSKDGAYTQAFWQQLANTWKKDVYGLGVLYGHEKYGEKWWELMGNVAEGLKATRMNSLAVYPLQLLLDAPGTKRVGDEYTFDFTYFDAFISFFLDRGVVKYLEGNALLGTTYASNTWGFILDNKPDGDGMFLRKVEKLYPAYSAGVAGKMDADCDLFYRQYLTALNQHLELRGLKDRWVQHIEDEAGSTREQAEYMDFVNNYFLPRVPNVRYGDPMDHAYADWFIENTTILNPLTSQFDANKAKYEQAIQNGTEVWLYSCLNPQGANLNKFIDKPVWQIRSIAWLSYAYGVTGHLQWSYNGWWTDAATGEVYIGQDEANVQRFRYKGDDFYVYPDIEGNTFEQSIRSLSSRDSSEEYELLAMVGARDAEHKAWAEKLVSKIVTSNTNYSSDTALMAQCRRDLIEVASKAKNIDGATPPLYEDDKPLFAQTEVPANVAAVSFENNLDVTGVGYTLSTVGNASALTYSDLSKKGKALKFAGDQTTYLTLENNLGQMFNPAQTSFTVSAWIYQSARTVEPVIVGQLGTNGRTWLYLNSAHKIASFFGGSEGNFETDYVLPLAQWTHVAITVQNTASGRGNVTTYVNGAVKKTGSVAIDSSTDKMIIGRHKNTPTKYFQGELDELRVYNVCLTPQQLYSEYYYGYPPVFAKVDDVKFTSCRGGELPSLPEKVKVTLDNGMVNYVAVTWNNDFVPGDLESAGVKTRTGTLNFDGEEHSVTALMTVYEIAGSTSDVVTPVGVKPLMPSSVTVTDGLAQIGARVIWAAVEESKYALAGSYTVVGYLPSVPGITVTQKVTVKAVGDKTALLSQIDAFLNKTESDYTAKSWAAYKAEIDAGKTLTERYKPFAEKLAAAQGKISAAEADLVNVKALRAYVEAHKGKTAADFTESSFAEFAKKLLAAEAVLGNPDATQAMVDTAKAEMEAAVNGLTAAEKPDSKGCKGSSGANTTATVAVLLTVVGAALLLKKRKSKDA